MKTLKERIAAAVKMNAYVQESAAELKQTNAERYDEFMMAVAGDSLGEKVQRPQDRFEFKVTLRGNRLLLCGSTREGVPWDIEIAEFRSHDELFGVSIRDIGFHHLFEHGPDGCWFRDANDRRVDELKTKVEDQIVKFALT